MSRFSVIVDTVARSDADLVATTHLRAEIAQLEQQPTLRIVAIVAIANGVLFAVLRYLPLAGQARWRLLRRFRQ